MARKKISLKEQKNVTISTRIDFDYLEIKKHKGKETLPLATDQSMLEKMVNFSDLEFNKPSELSAFTFVELDENGEPFIARTTTTLYDTFNVLLYNLHQIFKDYNIRKEDLEGKDKIRIYIDFEDLLVNKLGISPNSKQNHYVALRMLKKYYLALNLNEKIKIDPKKPDELNAKNKEILDIIGHTAFDVKKFVLNAGTKRIKGRSKLWFDLDPVLAYRFARPSMHFHKENLFYTLKSKSKPFKILYSLLADYAKLPNRYRIFFNDLYDILSLDTDCVRVPALVKAKVERAIKEINDFTDINAEVEFEHSRYVDPKSRRNKFAFAIFKTSFGEPKQGNQIFEGKKAIALENKIGHILERFARGDLARTKKKGIKINSEKAWLNATKQKRGEIYLMKGYYDAWFKKYMAIDVKDRVAYLTEMTKFLGITNHAMMVNFTSNRKLTDYLNGNYDFMSKYNLELRDLMAMIMVFENFYLVEPMNEFAELEEVAKWDIRKAFKPLHLDESYDYIKNEWPNLTYVEREVELTHIIESKDHKKVWRETTNEIRYDVMNQTEYEKLLEEIKEAEEREEYTKKAEEKTSFYSTLIEKNVVPEEAKERMMKFINLDLDTKIKTIKEDEIKEEKNRKEEALRKQQEEEQNKVEEKKKFNERIEALKIHQYIKREYPENALLPQNVISRTFEPKELEMIDFVVEHREEFDEFVKAVKRIDEEYSSYEDVYSKHSRLRDLDMNFVIQAQNKDEKKDEFKQDLMKKFAKEITRKSTSLETDKIEKIREFKEDLRAKENKDNEISSYLDKDLKDEIYKEMDLSFVVSKHLEMEMIESEKELEEQFYQQKISLKEAEEEIKDLEIKQRRLDKELMKEEIDEQRDLIISELEDYLVKYNEMKEKEFELKEDLMKEGKIKMSLVEEYKLERKKAGFNVEMEEILIKEEMKNNGIPKSYEQFYWQGLIIEKSIPETTIRVNEMRRRLI